MPLKSRLQHSARGIPNSQGLVLAGRHNASRLRVQGKRCHIRTVTLQGFGHFPPFPNPNRVIPTTRDYTTIAPPRDTRDRLVVALQRLQLVTCLSVPDF